MAVRMLFGRCSSMRGKSRRGRKLARNVPDRDQVRPENSTSALSTIHNQNRVYPSEHAVSVHNRSPRWEFSRAFDMNLA